MPNKNILIAQAVNYIGRSNTDAAGTRGMGQLVTEADKKKTVTTLKFTGEINPKSGYVKHLQTLATKHGVNHETVLVKKGILRHKYQTTVSGPTKNVAAWANEVEDSLNRYNKR